VVFEFLKFIFIFKKHALNLKVEIKKQMASWTEPSGADSIKLLLKMPSGRRLERMFLKTYPAKVCVDRES
jgi:hypothetical protein